MTSARFPKMGDTLDPDAPLGKIFGWQIQLEVGETLETAVVDPVDSNSTAVDPSPIATISEVTSALSSGSLWKVTFLALGIGLTGDLYVRLRWTWRDESGTVRQGDDKTGRILVRQS